MKGSRKVRSEKSEVKRDTPFIAELTSLKSSDLFRTLTSVETSVDSHVIIEGRTCINFSSNDYLNLSHHPQIVDAAISALKQYGFGSGASRLLSGTSTPHVELEERIAEFKNTEASLLFNTGYAANTGILPAIAGDDAVIFSDELNHASIVDGARLAKAPVEVYRHRDMDHLESLLKSSVARTSVKRRLIVTDTVFSMDGDIAPLTEIAWLSDTYDALMMIDDAHGTGVLGNTGRGGLEHFGIKTDNIIQMGTLSKAAGCYGAFAAGNKDVVDLLVNRARSFMYSTSLPPAVAAAGIKALDIIDTGSGDLRKKLQKNTEQLLHGLKGIGFDTLDSETPIIPILTGDAKNALETAHYLYENNIYAPAIRPPTVPEGKCRIRFSVTAGHTDEDIQMVLQCLKKYK